MVLPGTFRMFHFCVECRRTVSEGLGQQIEALSSDLEPTGCESLFPPVHSTRWLSSSTCPEAVLRQSFHLLTERCGWSETYVLWLKDWYIPAAVEFVQNLPCQTQYVCHVVVAAAIVDPYGCIRSRIVLAGWQEISLYRSYNPLCGVESVCLQENLKTAMQTGTCCRGWLHSAFLDALAPLLMFVSKH